MAADERRLRAELPEFLELLGNVSDWVGGLDLRKSVEVPAEDLEALRDGLLRALAFLHDLFAFRGEPPPAPVPGIAYGSLGPSLKRTLPQRLAAQLADELNAVGGNRLEDLSQFTALGLFSRVSDLLRFVGFLEAERAAGDPRAAPPTVVSARVRRSKAAAAPAVPPPARAASPAAPKPAAPAPPAGPGPDLSAYDIRIDEAGERIDQGSATVWFASAAGPGNAAGGLASAFAVPFPGGVVLAVADGVESSLGARLASVVGARAFCRAAAASPACPEAAVGAAQGHLDMLLAALLSAGDESEALRRVRGAVPPENARRILAHTREPEEALRRIAPALATGLLGVVAVEARSGWRVSIVRLGPGFALVRGGGRVEGVLEEARAGASSFLGPGPRGREELGRLQTGPPLTLSPGDGLLVATPALGRGVPGPWTGLVSLWAPFPDGLSTGESARDLLRRAERWGVAEPPSFGGPLAFGFLLVR